MGIGGVWQEPGELDSNIQTETAILHIETMERKAPIYFSQVLDRAMGILECFKSDENELRLSDIVARTRLHKSTAYRLLEAMRGYGLVAMDEETGKFHLGLRLFELGSLAIGRVGIERYAHPTLERLVQQTGETAHLCVLDGSDVVYVAKVESRATLRIPSAVGRRNPAYCTGVGKVLLAYLSEDQLADYLAQTPLQPLTRKTITSKGTLRAELKSIASVGYAIDDQEIEDGVRCVGAPVRDYSGRVIAAISVAGPSMRLTRDKIPKIIRYVMTAADAISELAGYGSRNGATIIRSGNGRAARNAKSPARAASRPRK